jgi:NAD(P)-dependent dehydrogenase (short-subunit alcohol dehydrogenase family)
MNIDLTRQAAVVAGAGRGIGLAVTRALTASGAHVIAGTRRSCAGVDQLAAWPYLVPSRWMSRAVRRAR